MVVKLFAFSRRRGDVSADEFHAHWVAVHARQIADEPSLSRHVRRYELRRRLEADETAGLRSEWDGVASLEFDSLADFEAMQAEPAFGAHADDGREFREDKQLVAFTTGPHLLLAPTGNEEATVEVVRVLQRAPSVTHAEFVSSWFERERDAFAGTVSSGMLGAEQWHAVQSPGATVDAVGHYRLASLGALLRWQADGFADAIGNLDDPPGSVLFVAQPPTVIDLGRGT